MAKSASRKLREKQVREGKMDAAELRSPFAKVDMRSRKTKTKQEVLNQIARKERHRNPNFTGGEQGSFYLYSFFENRVDEKIYA